MSRIKRLNLLLEELNVEVIPFNNLSKKYIKRVFPKNTVFNISKDGINLTLSLNDNDFIVQQEKLDKTLYFKVIDKNKVEFKVYMSYNDLEREGHVEGNITKLYDRLREKSYSIEEPTLTREEAKELIPTILKTKNIYEPKKVAVDYGSIRGQKQGKRVGGQVTGGMSDAVYFQGVHVYNDTFGNLPDYEKLERSEKTKVDLTTLLNLTDGGFAVGEKDRWKPDSVDLYLKARSYGLNHTDAMMVIYVHNS